MKKQLNVFLILVFFFCLTSIGVAQTGKIAGTVTDKSNGDPLPGANLMFKEFNIGTASDFDGKYLITNIPVGKHKLTVSYIGYEKIEKTITILENRTLQLNIKLTHKTIEGETVVVTGQASAQTQALNQQISSKTIKNIVSSKSIQELPEANAAEAVGRLPGVSLERSGGEGAKVIIRGLAPKYSKVQIDGVSMAATGKGDRSTDLSMISPYMLEGIEVTKSIQADQEADATGGIVNFRIKTAPEKTTFNAIAEGGHSSLPNDYGNYKTSIGGSGRFFDNKLGIYAQFNFEKKNNSSDELGGLDYYQENDSTQVETRHASLIDANRIIDRLGATLVMDYNLPTTKIKFSNFTSRINTDRQNYQIDYRYFANGYGRSLVDNTNNLTIMTNSLRIDQYFGNFEINGGLTYAFSENEVPEELKLNIIWDGDTPPFGQREKKDRYGVDPYSLPDSLKITGLPTALGEFRHEESFTKENELGLDLNFTYKENLSNDIGIKIKFGGKYKQKSKVFDKTVLANNINFGGSQFFRNMIIDLFRDQLSDANRSIYNTPSALIYYPDFVDPNYKNDDFLGGKFIIDNMPNLEWFRTIDDEAIKQGLFHPYGIASLQDDYNGTENYWALYIKPEIQIGEDFTFIPGLRYENNKTEYTGYRIDGRTVLHLWDPFTPDTTTVIRENSFLLPMIQFFYQPTTWLNVKGGYTKTLQRPNYSDIIPSWVLPLFGDYVAWKNPTLRPEQSTNLDLQVSLFSDKIGLVSVGAFHKKIKDMMFWTGDKAIVDTSFYGLPADMRFKRTGFVVNNENDVLDYGLELEWKSNFWWLPGILKGLVVNVNYTRNISEAKYPRTRIIQKYDENFQLTLTNNDTTYTNPMILQPDNLFNLTIGYDYKGFSFRWAFRYKSNIFKNASWFKDLRGYSTDFLRHDIAIKQQLPVEGLELYFNINNLTDEFERDVIRPRVNPKNPSLGTFELTRHEEHYGRFTTLGIRYRY